MKKVFISLALILASLGVAKAQDNAIGLRGVFNGAEISFQRALSDANRLEFDAGFWNKGPNLEGVYQWTWDLPALADGFKWYAGVGAGVGFWEMDNNNKGYFNVGVVGQVGIEYNFNIPLQLSLDYRPAWYFLNSSGGYWSGIALGIRYKF